jgi:hypothetical protein
MKDTVHDGTIHITPIALLDMISVPREITRNQEKQFAVSFGAMVCRKPAH